MFESIEISKIVLFFGLWALLGFGVVAFNYTCATVSDPHQNTDEGDYSKIQPELPK